MSTNNITRNSENSKVIAAIFGNNPAVSLDERARVTAEIQKIGGGLNFEVNKTENGWTAQCKELPGIVAGSTNPDPTGNEIETEIRSAIFAAFNVQEMAPEKKSPYFGIQDLSGNLKQNPRNHHVGGENC
ncbi:hypothetical protein HY415_01470 [Candidatus Kaiserbacteria bacterium]|uniref:Uncharacterized protein n=1 Tax=Candidatus Sungiibacteriota bacterium TaxID=2750080 RepID=A0A931SCP6_9BACT|nr:hypothetical protein [Candidatus Sungbacteria bacterium]MBI4088743.1 hypothetical protein [Candidatus Kaiserbacteria bacterium]